MIHLETILFLILDGLLLGAIYALFAIGLTLLLSVVKIVNAAHGDLFMWSAMITAFLSPVIGVFPAALIMLLLMVATGFLIDRTIFQRLRLKGKPEEMEMMSVIVTVALSIVLINLNIYYFVVTGQMYWKLVPPFIPGGIPMLGLILRYQRLIAAMIAILLIVLLFAFLKFTRIGKAVRAVAQDREAAMLMGVNINLVMRVTWGLACLLAGMAGFLISPIYVVEPFMGFVMLIKGFAVIIIGGMGSVTGSLIAGLAIGITENLAGYLWRPEYKDTFAFFIMVIVLLIKGKGLFAKS